MRSHPPPGLLRYVHPVRRRDEAPMALEMSSITLNGTKEYYTSRFWAYLELHASSKHFCWQLRGSLRETALTSPLPLQQRATPAIATSINRTYAADAKAAPTEVSSILEQRIRGVQEEAGLAETGRVLSVGYGNTTISNVRALEANTN